MIIKKLFLKIGVSFFFGYLPLAAQEMKKNDSLNIKKNDTLRSKSIDEVVVVGFGKQKKDNITGAISQVKMDEILGSRPVTTGSGALQGAIPGLQITNGTGRPGTFDNISIRGLASINGGSPLILVNNVPMDINNINPQDIETVTVLKDAASSAIYGARAAFGVILITTKGGKKNQRTIANYSLTNSFDLPSDLPQKADIYDFVKALNDWGVKGYWTNQNVQTWLQLLGEYRTNPSIYPHGVVTIGGTRYPLKNTNIIRDYYREAGITQIHDLSITGGSERSTYRVAAGYSNQDGIIVTNNDSFRRYTLNTDYTMNITKNLSVQTNLNYLNSLTKEPIGNYYRLISYVPYAATGNHTLPDGRIIPFDTPDNLERLNFAPRTDRDNLRIFGKVEYKPLPGLSLTGEYTYGYSTYKRATADIQPETVNAQVFTYRPSIPENTFYRIETGNTRYNAVNLYSKYQKNLGNHHFSFLAGFNNESSSSESYWVKRTNLISPNLPSISQATGIITTSDSYGEWAVMGIFGRFNYNYKEKYFFDFNVRYDGSSRFPKNNRWGLFTPFSLGWNIAKENFMENTTNTINILKPRFSYGEIGNQDIRRNNTSLLYPAIPGLEARNSDWIDPATGLLYVTLFPPGLVRQDFTWERVRTANYGIDTELFRHRLNISFDFFKRQTLGMFIPGSELPAIIGTRPPDQNAGDMETQGWELQIGWKDRLNNNFNYYISAVLSDNQSKITKYRNEAGLLGQYYIGQNIGEIWGYVTDGYYTTDDFVPGSLDANLQNGKLKEGVVVPRGITPNPGDIKYKDLNGDGIIDQGNNTLNNPGDRTVIGNSNRRYQYGLRGGFSYKNFDFSFFIQGVGKRDVWISNDVFWPYNGEFGIVYTHQLDYWTPENTNAYYPRNYPLGGVNYGYNKRVQTKYLSNGAYARLQNITIGYSIPKDVLKDNFLKSVKIYLSGENLFTLDHLPAGLNAELSDLGNGGNYPFLKKYAIGINISF